MPFRNGVATYQGLNLLSWAKDAKTAMLLWKLDLNINTLCRVSACCPLSAAAERGHNDDDDDDDDDDDNNNNDDELKIMKLKKWFNVLTLT